MRIVDDWFAVLDDTQRRVEKALALCERLRESLNQEAFRGDLVPTGPTVAGLAEGIVEVAP